MTQSFESDDRRPTTDETLASAPTPTPSTDSSAKPAPTHSSTTQPSTSETSRREVTGSLAGSTWVGLIIGALLLILLIVFIVQNQQQATVTLFAWEFSLSAGLIYLIFAIFGALIMALVGGVRMLQLRRQVRQGSR